MDTIPHNGTETSRAAAERIRPEARRMREVIYAAIKAAGFQGLTRPEIEAKTGYAGNTVRPRVIELRRATRVVDSDRKRKGCLVVVLEEFAPKPKQEN